MVANTRDLIQQLGGAVRVAAMLGVSAPAVSNWCAAARGIPPQHYASLWRAARERGVNWTPPGFEGLAIVPAQTVHCQDDMGGQPAQDREFSVNGPRAA